MERAALTSLASTAAGLRLLVLHGSRARGSSRVDSDWDFAYLADSTFDADALLGTLAEQLGRQVDLADLSRASALLRFKAAADGVLIFEARAGIHGQFRAEAIATWCDMEPVLTRAYDAVLARQAR